MVMKTGATRAKTILTCVVAISWTLVAQGAEPRRPSHGNATARHNGAALRQIVSGRSATAKTMSTARKSIAGGPRLLRVVGRFAYDSTFTSNDLSGVDTILVEVRDDDTIGHSVLWSGYTDSNGYFDTGVVDISADDNEPDLYVYFETDSPFVSVEDGDLISDHYSWDSFDSLLVDDFTGDFIDFGTHAPAETGVGSNIPALDILQLVNRAHRFVLQVTNLNVSKVTAQWPSGDDFGYDYDGEMTFGEFIYLAPQILHLYAHHLERAVGMVVAANNDCGSDCQYCETGDANCSTVVDCSWCPMTPGIARSEGFADWFPSAANRAFMAQYAYDSGEPFRIPTGYHEFFPPEIFPDDPFDDVSDLSEIRAYCGADALDNADRVINVVSAMLEDLADDVMDDHAGDGLSECAYLTDGTVLTTYLIDKPADVLALIDQLILDYPNDLPSLYSAALNISPVYTARFPADTEPPGIVRAVVSPSHPIGQGGPLPCITLEWQFPIDDASGACAYSYEWTTDPAGLEPDMLEDVLASCTMTQGPFNLGQHYISMRAKDCAGNWSGEWEVFGPFEVTDCNNNGIVDICEGDCQPESEENGGCSIGDFCAGQFNCGFRLDCNHNHVPDSCDVADGTSEDCNESNVPDECESVFHWAVDGAAWNEAASWEEGQFPTDGSDACIDIPGDETASILHATAVIGILACEETLDIYSTTTPRPDVTLNDSSWIRGDLKLHGNTGFLRVNNRLEIDGRFIWTGSSNSQVTTLTGAGETRVHGGATFSSGVVLDDHRLILESESSSTSTGTVWFSGGSILEIMQDATYDHQGTGRAFVGTTDDQVINHGTIVRSAATGNSDFNVPVTNNGLIHLQSGELTLRRGSSHSGTVQADPGTLFRLWGGGHSFLPSSSIIAERVKIDGGGSIGGTYNVSVSTTKDDSRTLTFTDQCTVVNYGPTFDLDHGTVHFNAAVGGPIHFDSFTLGESSSHGGIAWFNSGDPVDIDELQMNPGTVRGSSDVTINTRCYWGSGSHFRDPGTINVNGTMTVGSGSNAKNLADRTMHIFGTTSMVGGFGMTGSASLHIHPGAVLDIQVDTGGSIISGASLHNAGTLVKSAGTATSRISSDVTNTGTVEVRSGVLEFYTYYGYFYIQTAGQTILNGGDIRMFGTKSFSISGGTLTGYGTITGKVSIGAATVAPGLAVGTLIVNGNYTQNGESTLEIEIESANPGGYDRLEVSGTATLSGELLVLKNAGFTPEMGDAFVILTANSVVGEFDNVTIPPPLEIRYEQQQVKLIVPLPGDLDENGIVDLFDWSLFMPCFGGMDNGSPPTCPADVDADLDHDGDVDFDDLTTMVAAAKI